MVSMGYSDVSTARPAAEPATSVHHFGCLGGGGLMVEEAMEANSSLASRAMDEILVPSRLAN